MTLVEVVTEPVKVFAVVAIVVVLYCQLAHAPPKIHVGMVVDNYCLYTVVY
jgi:hypothetical protein